MKFPAKLLCSIFFSFLCSFQTLSQTTLLQETFEGPFTPPGWSNQNYTITGNTWKRYEFNVYSGTYSAACIPNTFAANSWLFTSPINLIEGKTYVLKYYLKLESEARLRVHLKKQQDYESPSIIIRNNLSILQAGNYTLFQDTIVCENSGIYFIGFQNFSNQEYNSGSFLDEILLTEENQLPPCSTLTPGTITASLSTACPGTSFQLSITGNNTNSTGIKRSWQYSLNGINWENLTSGYHFIRNIQRVHLAPAYYRFTDTCVQTNTTSISNVVQITNTPYNSCYCVPTNQYCFNLSITNVTIPGSSINNTSTCIFGGYTNYTNFGTATGYIGHVIPVQVTINSLISRDYSIGIWLDSDHSGSFTENEFTLSTNLSSTTNILQIPVPLNALPGLTRLRIRIKYISPAITPLTWTDACTDTYSDGETEDYKILLETSTNCTGPVTAGTITAPVTVCPNTSFLLTANGASSNQNMMRYAWQKSIDNNSWTNITNTSYLISPFQISQNNSYFYRLTDTCLISGQHSVSPSIQVQSESVFPYYCIPAVSDCSVYGIDSVSIGSIKNGSTGCSSGGYGNYITLSTPINTGTQIPFYVKFKPGGLTSYLYILVDLNRNGIYENYERVFNEGSSSGSISGTITIPYTATPGETGIRLLVNSSNFYTTSCTTNGTGEIEDYKAVITQVAPPSTKFSYYVNQNAAAGGNGLTWATAFSKINSAFALAATGDTIRVSKGIYTVGTTNTQYLNLKDSLLVLGGYPDTGTPTDNNRNAGTYKTILSGEIGTSSITDNSRIILNALNVKGATVDGFIIEKCYQNSTGTVGTIMLSNSDVLIKNCVIRNNINLSQACGINVSASNLVSINNIFEGNYGITPVADSAAAIISIRKASTATFINNLVAKNSTKYLFNVSKSKLLLTNSTVFKNTGYSIIHDTSTFDVHNSIFYYNASGYLSDTSEFYKDDYSTITLKNSIHENYNYTSSSFRSSDPSFIDTSSLVGPDGLYFTADDGLSLRNPCSPAINTGNNTLSETVSYDLTGRPRIKNGIVDLGSYEIQENITTQPTVVYVKKNATGLNNGTSWQNAFTDLQSAFRICSDTIKVAAGNYPVSSSDNNAYYQLQNNRVVIGGYPNTGNPGNAEWNPELNSTNIDGTVTLNRKSTLLVVSANNDSTSLFIGFNLINATISSIAPGTISVNLRIVYKSTPIISNLKIDPSKTFAYTLLQVNTSSKPIFKKCTFYNTLTDYINPTTSRDISIINNSLPYF